MVGEQAAFSRADARLRHQGDGERKAGEGANDHRVPKRAGGGDKRLLHGIGRAHGRRDDGGGAHACLIGEKAAANTCLQGEHEGGADEAARGRLIRESAGADELAGRPDELCMAADEDEAAHHIDDGHGGHTGRAHSRDALQPEEQHHRHQRHQEEPRTPRGHVQRALCQHAGHGIGLGDVADAECRDGREYGKYHRQPLAAHAALQCVHRAAYDVAFLIPRAVADGQQALRVAGGHAQQAGEHAPENGSRAAHGHRRSHAHDVARAYIGRQ